MTTFAKVIENIKRIQEVEISDFNNEVICAFAGFEFEGETEVIVSEDQAYINHKDAPIVRFETEENEDGTISVTDAWEA